MSVEILREAARLMRKWAEAATEGRWEAFRYSDPVGPYGVASEHGIDHVPAVLHLRANAEHIASWHPAVALAVADWLEATSSGIEKRGVTARWKPAEKQALTVARAYLGKADEA